MSDAKRLQKEINCLSVLIKKHKEQKAAEEHPRTDASKYTWSSRKPESFANGLIATTTNMQYFSNPMQRGRKRQQYYIQGEHVPNKIIRKNAPPTSVTMASKTGVAFDSKFKWTKDSSQAQKTGNIRLQSFPKTSVTSVVASTSSITRTNSTVLALNISPSAETSTTKPVLKNTKYKYHKVATGSSSASNAKPKSVSVKMQNASPKGFQKWSNRSLTYRRKPTSKWASKPAIANPYKINRVGKTSPPLSSTTERLHHPRPRRSNIGKALTSRKIMDRRHGAKNASTHITLSKAAFEGLLQRQSMTLKQTLAKRVVAKSQETARYKKQEKKNQYCLYYGRFGKCMRGDSCKFIHDPSRIAVCTRFLRGTCREPNCSFSHKVEKEKIPVCLFFLRGKCSVPNCPYLHVFLGKDATVCKSFANTGFCPDANECKMQHIKCCPEYYETGRCLKAKACHLPHFRIRKHNAKAEPPEDEKNKSTDHGKLKIQTGSDNKVVDDQSSVSAPSSSCPDFLSLTVDSPEPLNKPFKREGNLIKPRFGKLARKQRPTSSSQ